MCIYYSDRCTFSYYIITLIVKFVNELSRLIVQNVKIAKNRRAFNLFLSFYVHLSEYLMHKKTGVKYGNCSSY